jgi:hypothetical protein
LRAQILAASASGEDVERPDTCRLARHPNPGSEALLKVAALLADGLAAMIPISASAFRTELAHASGMLWRCCARVIMTHLTNDFNDIRE